MSGDKQRLGFAGCRAAVFNCIEAGCTCREIRAFVASVEAFLFAALDVRANTALADCGKGAAVVIRPARTAPLSEEAVIAGEATVSDWILALSGDGDEGGFLTGAILDPGTVISVYEIEGIFLERLAGKVLTLTTECLALGDGAFRHIAMTVERLALCGDASAAVAWFFVLACITVQSAIGGYVWLLHQMTSFLVVYLLQEDPLVRRIEPDCTLESTAYHSRIVYTEEKLSARLTFLKKVQKGKKHGKYRNTIY